MNKLYTEIQQKIDNNNNEILNLNDAQVEELRQIYEAEVEILEEEIKKMQIQRDMYLFNIKMYEKKR